MDEFNSIQTYWKDKLIAWEKSRYSALSIVNPAAWPIRQRMKLAARLISHLSSESATWLDLGCGTGRLERLLPSYLNLIGYDISEAGIAAATKQGLKNSLFFKADITTQKFPTCDGVVMLGVSDWLSKNSFKNLIKELNCHHLIMSYTLERKTLLQSLYKWYHLHVRKTSQQAEFPMTYSESEIFETIQMAGFKFIKQSHHGLGHGRLAYFIRHSKND